MAALLKMGFRYALLAGCCAVLACRSEPSTASGAQPIPEPEETDSPEPKAHMQEHLSAALAARDAVIAGDLGGSRAAVEWLVAHRYPETLPPTWKPYAVRMQTAAKGVAAATDLTAAANAVGVLAAACGSCHTHVGGPQRKPTGFETSSDVDVLDRMHRHAWAVDRLWEGLITPWDDAWRVGAEVLSEARFRVQPGDEHAVRLHEGLARVQRLGHAARRERSLQRRSEMYGQLLTTCAGCHDQVGVGPASTVREKTM